MFYICFINLSKMSVLLFMNIFIEFYGFMHTVTAITFSPSNATWGTFIHPNYIINYILLL